MPLSRDIDRILPILRQDPEWAAYAICNLEEPAFSNCRWHLENDSLVLVYWGLHTPLLVSFGVASKQLLMEAGATAPRFLINFRAEQAATVSEVLRTSQCHSVLRMVLKGLPVKPAAAEKVIALSTSRLKELEQLYSQGGGPIFNAAQLALGYFHGVERNGVLVSAAGVHSVSHRYSIATVGNVATHPDYRGQGLAKACTRAVVDRLQREGIRTIILNADTDNTPAVHAYKRLGFETYLEYQDGFAER